MKNFFFLLLLIPSSTLAQKMSISGVVKDSSNVGLQQATVLVLNPKDSSLINFTSTDKEGAFVLKNIARQKIWLKITFVGYAPYNVSLEPLATDEGIDVGVIQLASEIRQLAEVTIESSRAAVTVKKDTIEFNAGAFKTQANAVVEDLLKKLPGVEVDADGTIRAQGKEVQRVTVDGKNFFGNDPKVATRNLPADAIDKVQVFDKKSDQAEFSGIDDGQREKTINLALKEEKRNAMFGNIMAGAGTEERYQSRINLNRFRKTEQFSILGMANNVNEQGFGIEDYMNFTGGSRQMMSGGRVRVELNSDNQSGIPLSFGGRATGLMNSLAGGLNYNKEFNKKTEVSASYFYNQLDHDLDQDLERINFFQDQKLRFNQRSQQSNHNENHQFNTIVSHKIDSMNSIKLTVTGRYNFTDSHQRSESENLNANGDLVNVSDRTTISDGATASVNSNLLWRHKFNKKGRTLSTNLQFNMSETERDGTQNALTEFFTPESRTELLEQKNDQLNAATTFGTALSYTEPLGNRKYIETNYSFQQTNNKVDRNVFDIADDDAVFNAELSNEYTSQYQYHRGGINFKLNRIDYNLSVGASIQQTYLKGNLKTLNTKVDRSYQNFLPVARFNYDFSDTRHLQVNYETSVDEPSIQELQPVVDNSDPLNISEGNPNLRPAYQHRLRTEFVTFNPASFINLFAFVEGTYTEHAITTSQEITEDQIRISRPVNVSGAKQLNSDVTFGFPITSLKSRVSVSGNMNFERSVSVLNEATQNITQQKVGGRVRYDFNYDDIFDLGISANLSRQSSRYEFSSETDQRFINQTYRAEAGWSFLKNCQLSCSFEYLVYLNTTNDFSQSIPLFNVSFSRFFLKNKSGELKLAAVNFLDKSIGITQTSSVNYIERTTANSLGRYFMLSFNYALNRHMSPHGMRRPPRGGIQIIR